jgi:hypothetical protein
MEIENQGMSWKGHGKALANSFDTSPSDLCFSSVSVLAAITDDEAVEIAKSHEKIRDLLDDEVRTEVEYSEEWKVWIVSFLRDDAEIAFVTVSLEGEILEVVVEEEAERGLTLEFLYPWMSTPALFLACGSLFLLAFWGFGKGLSPKNVDLLMCLFWIPGVLIYWQNLRIGVVLVYLPYIYLSARLIHMSKTQTTGDSEVNFDLRVVKVLTLILFLYGIFLTLTGGVDDSGWMGLEGARMILRGQVPYGHLNGGDTYGPLHYLLFTPLAAFEHASTYNASARFLTILFVFLALIGLKRLGDRIGGRRFGTLLTFAWIVLPYPLISMMESQVSHFFPAVFTIWALYYTESPIASGALLGLGTQTEFYPALLFPLWMSYLKGKGSTFKISSRQILFLLSFIVGNFLPFTIVFWQEEGLTRFIEATILFQEGGGPGSFQSIWSIWGQYPFLKVLKVPIMWVFLALSLLLYFYPRKKTFYQLVVLSTSVIVGVHLWKNHLGVGGYIPWFQGFLLIAILYPNLKARIGKTLIEAKRTL